MRTPALTPPPCYWVWLPCLVFVIMLSPVSRAASTVRFFFPDYIISPGALTLRVVRLSDADDMMTADYMPPCQALPHQAKTT